MIRSVSILGQNHHRSDIRTGNGAEAGHFNTYLGISCALCLDGGLLAVDADDQIVGKAAAFGG